ncbi:MAG: MarR family transcriptional regulator [Agathobacter sp.]|nr:MarR family transcriptional regulator [Agathobacter sp.]
MLERMTATIEETLNNLLVKLFKDLMEIEGKVLVSGEYNDISNNDMHIIEAIGVDEPKKMSAIAKLMSVTTGTLTKAMDALDAKGYVTRVRCVDDKRVVRVSLTEKGVGAFYHHEQFHRQMIEHIKEGLTDDEMTAVVCALAKLTDYFQNIYDEENEEKQYKNWNSIKEDNI